ncbi:MAG: hypothetical protein LPL29_02245 [Alphaproteobacteria bacterium]|nr:hypothetical protein [Alphaproteobacteria bacterium]
MVAILDKTRFIRSNETLRIIVRCFYADRTTQRPLIGSTVKAKAVSEGGIVLFSATVTPVDHTAEIVVAQDVIEANGADIPDGAKIYFDAIAIWPGASTDVIAEGTFIWKIGVSAP